MSKGKEKTIHHVPLMAQIRKAWEKSGSYFCRYGTAEGDGLSQRMSQSSMGVFKDCHAEKLPFGGHWPRTEDNFVGSLSILLLTPFPACVQNWAKSQGAIMKKSHSPCTLWEKPMINCQQYCGEETMALKLFGTHTLELWWELSSFSLEHESMTLTQNFV